MQTNDILPTVLEGIVEGRRGDLDEIRARISHVDPQTLPASTRSLYDSLGGGQGRGLNRFIMECKSSSPSLGMIREHYEPGAIARVYSRYAAGISVLCEPHRFGGDYDHLATVAASSHLPVLCKDFIVDEVQVHAARYFGADAVLLMLSVLSDEEYTTLQDEAHRLGMDVLTEAITEEEVERALRLGAKILGINNRNLHDLSIDLTRTERLVRNIPADVVVLSESGVRDNATVRAIGGVANGFLVGSQLTSQPDIDLAARELVYGPNKICGLTSWSAAQAAKANGAVYGGLIFEEASPRNVSRETAAEIIGHEQGLKYVAVSRRDAGYAELLQDGIVAVQVQAPYQGSIDGEFALIEKIRAELPEGVELWRAISMTSPEAAATAEALAASAGVDKLVLDAGDGGTGTTFDWDTVPESVKGRALLAGGLNPDNVDEALAVGCLGLDLNSGLEYGPDAGEWAGHKDAARVRSAFESIRSFTHEN
ncbi:bifunctional indole-3-glycerol-phosphate synthase TrpC/phosphoribosylanthranilate isomerase TrpF [Corynebacterium guangdongense]|uniref:N-(5'-phosphoribosyl)anthranilate isomerase n=1 Tax=Corynebacterium guangdongense TaxID=1783348 RepID=A0ABU2A1U0_9CORY|nr:bifunctional indole-3-glycerol-phosphate synthase TrpC/phosphoribosylanthranilate isomerase TrpF [Corynebacterium guangdongense]MDR7330568.1 indole-3-glycerol phosphate synthase/phosphoribosylanthranilate isomerase [Corynebacterium guangdongense]WJZ19122.1 Tryptophan biosynthesis protein TrpCF [Corynebacterium guangdongense]